MAPITPKDVLLHISFFKFLHFQYAQLGGRTSIKGVSLDGYQSRIGRMENAAQKLLRLVETYALRPGCTTGKFVQVPLQDGCFNIAFDAHQLLENLSCTEDDGMELLCCILRQCNWMHEASVGAACRVNFITYVVLHTYRILAKQAVVGQQSEKGGTIGPEFFERETNLFFKGTDVEEDDTRCCRSLMEDFLRELRVKGHPVNPIHVLTEVAASTERLSGADQKNDTKPVYLSPKTLREYLRKTFGHDPNSWGYEAGRLAVECFLFIYPHLLSTVHGRNVSVKDNRPTFFHAIADQLLCKVLKESDEWLTTGENEGCVVPGIAFVVKIRMKKTSDGFSGTCVCSPFHVFGTLGRNESCHVDLLLLFSNFLDGVTEKGDSGFFRLALMVQSVEKGLVVIIVQGNVAEEKLCCMEAWGNNTRTVLVVVAVDQATMTQLALAFGLLPKTLSSSQVNSAVGSLRIKSLFAHDSIRRSRLAKLRLFLVALEPPTMTTRTDAAGFRHSIVTVVFGGRCAADSVLVERLFSSQLHHLINMICLPAPFNAIMPAGGVAESYAVSYLGHKIDESPSQDNFSRCFKVRLMTALRSAITTYMEAVLQRSCGLSVEKAVEHVNVSLQRFGATNWDGKSSEPHYGNGLLALGLAGGHTLYNNAIPTPPLLDVSETLLSGDDNGVKSTILLADVIEWEAQVEVFSAYLTIGTCLDRLCFTSVMGKHAVVCSDRENERVDEIFFYPDVA